MTSLSPKRQLFYQQLIQQLSSKSGTDEVSGYFVPGNPLSETCDWICGSCFRSKSCDEIKNLMEEIDSEVKNSEGDESKLVKNLENFRRLLHPNHQILTELRRTLIPTFCRGGRKKLDDFPDEKFRQKLRMCVENKRVYDIVDPGCSTSRGKLFYEIAESIFQVKCRQFFLNKLLDENFDCAATWLVTEYNF